LYEIPFYVREKTSKRRVAGRIGGGISRMAMMTVTMRGML
jgi:hypothetical protein